MRKTKIICTLGPSSESEEKLREIMLAGMNVARFNFSHGSHEEHTKRFDRVMKISGELGFQKATLLDTKGPEIRLKDIEGGKTVLESGQTFTLTTEDMMGTNEKVSITYKNLIHEKSGAYPNQEMQDMLEMYCHSSVYMTVKWIMKEHVRSTEELADLMVEAMPYPLSQLFKKLNILD